MVTRANAYDDPLIAAVYDLENTGRADTDFYVGLAQNLGSSRVIDLGCGTGVLACELASRGHQVIGIDPAGAMLERARQRPGADRVEWIIGDASALAAQDADLVLMTGHVAQEIHDDDAWHMTLTSARRALRPGGHLAFESRNPLLREWEQWTPERTLQRLEDLTLGAVETWNMLMAVDADLVRFESHNRLASSGEDVVARGALRFRSRPKIEAGLVDAGFAVKQVYGDWRAGSVTPASPELIFVALADASGIMVAEHS